MEGLAGEAPARPPSLRSTRIDILRGIAVFGILLINIWTFSWGFQTLRYGLLPDTAPWLDRFAVFFCAAVAEQKFYPIFAFLFGAGYALHARSLKRAHRSWRAVRAVYRRRLSWLLGCGILHGTLIWFGDILTLYGATGFCILRFAHARLRSLQNNFCNWCVVWTVLMALNFVVALPSSRGDDAAELSASMAQQAQEVYAIYTASTAAEIAARRLEDYLSLCLQSAYLVPHVLALFLLGMMAVRRGWLTRPERHAVLWKRVRLCGLAIGIPFNLAWGNAVVAEAINPGVAAAWTFPVFAWLPLGGSLLAAAYVASVMLAGPKTIRMLQGWLAPVGRMALTNYLTQSVLCALLLQGTGLGLGKMRPAALLAIAFGIMLSQTLASRWWLARHAQGPVEAVYRRFARGGAFIQ